jgi:hypothetical protein
MDKNKNVWLLPTDKSSILYGKDDNYKLANSTMAMDWYISSAGYKPYNIYITSDEEIKEGDWGLDLCEDLGLKYQPFKVDKATLKYANQECKKIILTTDQDLIKDGVQAIDDEFLEWFVQNPSCEYVETKLVHDSEDHPELVGNPKEEWSYYDIIIPQEEPKQDCECTDECLGYLTKDCKRIEQPKQATLEEAAENYSQKYSQKVGRKYGFMDGAEWKAERMYSEEDLKSAFFNGGAMKDIEEFNEWFSQFKKQNNEQ